MSVQIRYRKTQARFLGEGPGKYDVAALVKNSNLKHGATVNYIFRVWDKDNLLINSKRGLAYINPKEDLVIFQSRIDVGKKIPARVGFEFEDAPLWQKLDREVPELVFSDKRFENVPTPRLVATVKNNSLTAVKEVEVDAVISDSDQNAVAVSSTYLEELPGGESREVSFTWPQPFAQEVSFIDLAAHFDWRKL